VTFILANDGRHADVVGAFERYRDYLLPLRGSFPRSAYALAMSDWYFNFEDHRCPHDAWLDALSLTEPTMLLQREPRSLSLHVRLLGAYHDGYIELLYREVFAYRFDVTDSRHGHHDWRYDEFRLSKDGRVIHEIEWYGVNAIGSWLIAASDVEFQWIPSQRNAEK
jgi:hypothetical protein